MIDNYLDMSAYSCTVISELFGTIASLKDMIKILEKQKNDCEEDLTETIDGLKERIEKLWSDCDFFEDKSNLLDKENEKLRQENEKLKRQVELLNEGITAALANEYWKWYYAHEDELND
jgi:cell division protein FtsB